MRRNLHIIFLLPLVALIFTASGCSPYRSRMDDGSEMTIPETYREAGGAKDTEGLTVGSGWWTRFGNERLNSIMDKALAGNLDLKTAFERLREARAAAGVAGSPLIPAVTLKGYGGRIKQGSLIDLDPVESYRASFATNYELDIWRKLSERARAGRLNALASQEELKALHAAISAEVVQEYFLLMERRAQLRLAYDSEAGYEDTLERVELHYREGLTSSESLYLARRSLSAVRARLPLIEADIKRAVNALALLTGSHSISLFDGVDGGVPNTVSLPEPPSFKAGLPSTLMKERPDIEAALLRVKAKDSLLAAAVSDRFPSFSLTAEYGGTSEKLRNLLDSPNILWSVLLEAAMPVIDGKRRALEVERAEARLKESLFEYQKTVLSAFKDVEDALSAVSAARVRVLELERHTIITSEALRRAGTDYRLGLTGYLPVIEAENTVNSSLGDLISARLGLINATIGVARALGGGGGAGGWSEMKIEEPATAQKK